MCVLYTNSGQTATRNKRLGYSHGGAENGSLKERHVSYSCGWKRTLLITPRYALDSVSYRHTYQLPKYLTFSKLVHPRPSLHWVSCPPCFHKGWNMTLSLQFTVELCVLCCNFMQQLFKSYFSRTHPSLGCVLITGDKRVTRKISVL